MKRKWKTILTILHEHGAMFGLELVKKSESLGFIRKLRRGTVYVDLARMEGQGLIKGYTAIRTRADKTHSYARKYTIRAKGITALRVWL